MPDGLGKQADGRVAWNDRGSTLAAFQQCVARIDPQRGELLVLAVTREALLHEQRTDLLLKEFNGVRFGIFSPGLR